MTAFRRSSISNSGCDPIRWRLSCPLNTWNNWLLMLACFISMSTLELSTSQSSGLMITKTTIAVMNPLSTCWPSRVRGGNSLSPCHGPWAWVSLHAKEGCCVETPGSSGSILSVCYHDYDSDLVCTTSLEFDTNRDWQLHVCWACPSQHI